MPLNSSSLLVKKIFMSNIYLHKISTEDLIEKSLDSCDSTAKLKSIEKLARMQIFNTNQVQTPIKTTKTMTTQSTQSTPSERESFILNLNNEFNRHESDEEDSQSNLAIVPTEKAPLTIVDGVITDYCFEHVPIVGTEAMKASSLFKVSNIVLYRKFTSSIVSTDSPFFRLAANGLPRGWFKTHSKPTRTEWVSQFDKLALGRYNATGVIMATGKTNLDYQKTESSTQEPCIVTATFI